MGIVKVFQGSKEGFLGTTGGVVLHGCRASAWSPWSEILWSFVEGDLLWFVWFGGVLQLSNGNSSQYHFEVVLTGTAASRL